MAESPRVTRMILFKHGVAFIDRAGPADGDFELSFEKDEMNDVLKSLAVWVARGDARVGAMAFDKPEDPEKALASRKLAFEFERTLEGFLAASRGRRVALDTAGGRVEGEVVGGDQRAAGERGEERTLLVRRADEEIALVPYGEIRAVRLLDASSRADLDFVLDRRRAATRGERRTVRVALSGRAEDLRVSYVIPAPTWRVSYRFAREANGETVIMAWGIVHNPADEDLQDIRLTLTTGQPVSFAIDLYNPKNVQRAVVEETSRAVAGPTTFERAPMMRMAAPAPAPAAGPMGGAMPPPPPGAPMPQRMAAAMTAASEGAATYEDRGELFEYEVASKVSLKRGSSAMVPLLGTKLRAKKERIWRAGSPPAPDLVLTFTNDTGAVLEEGPAVIYDGDAYAGEAMVPYSARGVEVKLGFAKDLGVRCKRESTHHVIVSGLRLARGFVAEEQRREEHHLLSAEIDHAEDVEVVFEVPKVHGRALDERSAQPFEETSSYRRFRLTVPARGKGTLTVIERWHDARRVEYTALGGPQLEEWLRGKFLDRATFDALAEVLTAWEDARQLDAKRQRVEEAQKQAYAKQSKISEQLGVLKESGPEGQLRLRYVKELEIEQDKINDCEREARQLRDAADAARRRGETKLAALTG